MPSLNLVGDNLGSRHKHFNTLVSVAYGSQVLTDIREIPEKAPIERLFKIDVASKHRDVNYIIENLKDDDILYVSRALKSKWLLKTEYQEIINPVSLENDLYPFMITTAVTKMKHWIHLNLKDAQRSEEFYKFYREKEFELAFKFLVSSSKVYIETEFKNIVYSISPRQFKLLCETCPLVAKIFFDSITTDERLKSQYLKQQKQYFASIKSVLKTDTEIYLDILEKYFSFEKFGKLKPIATKFVIQQHKDRFFKKPELYAAWLLDMETLATNLNTEEAMDLILKLAKAKYIKSWFSYKNVEPLIKRLKPQERAAFKKKIFVEKNLGQEYQNCLYDFPSSPIDIIINKPSIFDDYEHHATEYNDLEEMNFRCMLKKRKYANWVNSGTFCTKTILDKLFDEYRFAGFEKVFMELKSRIKAESSKDHRQYMMLVLVSKAGGRVDALSTLIDLLVTHRNEPSNLRAAIIRSLVKKSSIWRLPEEPWTKLLNFANNLGLDGKPTDCWCIEGLQAVVLRNILSGGKFSKELLEAYLNKFTTFTNYSLSIEEKTKASTALSKLLLDICRTEENMTTALSYMDKVLDTVKDFQLSADTYPGLIDHVKYLAKIDLTATNPLLKRLYKAKIARKQLFDLNFELFKSEESYLNALRHNAKIFNAGIIADQIQNNKMKTDRFLKKISIYFNEENGIGHHILETLKTKLPNKFIARPINLLCYGRIDTFIENINMSQNTIEIRQFKSAMKANAHVLRPFQKLNIVDWTSPCTKYIANKVLNCRQIDVIKNIEELLKNKRTLGLAMALAKRTKNFIEIFSVVAPTRPTKAIKVGLTFIQNRNELDIKIWKNIKDLIKKLDFMKQSNKYILKCLTRINFNNNKGIW